MKISKPLRCLAVILLFTTWLTPMTYGTYWPFRDVRNEFFDSFQPSPTSSLSTPTSTSSPPVSNPLPPPIIDISEPAAPGVDLAPDPYPYPYPDPDDLPKTGDNANPEPWLVLMALSAFVLRQILFYDRNREKRRCL
jgi:hypothetical protein